MIGRGFPHRCVKTRQRRTQDSTATLAESGPTLFPTHPREDIDMRGNILCFLVACCIIGAALVSFAEAAPASGATGPVSTQESTNSRLGATWPDSTGRLTRKQGGAAPSNCSNIGIFASATKVGCFTPEQAFPDPDCVCRNETQRAAFFGNLSLFCGYREGSFCHDKGLIFGLQAPIPNRPRLPTGGASAIRISRRQ